MNCGEKIGGTGGRANYAASFDGNFGGGGAGEVGEQKGGYLRKKFGETFSKFDVGSPRSLLQTEEVGKSSDGFGFSNIGLGNFSPVSTLKSECLRTENRMNELFKGDIRAKLERYKQISLETQNSKPKIALLGSARVVPRGPGPKLAAH